MEERERIQKIMLEVFHKEVQSLDPELQSILIDDIVTAFNNRLNFMKKIQRNREIRLGTNNSSAHKPMQVLDPDTVQSMDETNKRWIECAHLCFIVGRYSNLKFRTRKTSVPLNSDDIQLIYKLEFHF